MLTQAVESYLALRRAVGFASKSSGFQLKSFAAFSEARGLHYVSSDLAIEWAGLARLTSQRALRLGSSSDSLVICAPKTHATRCHQRSSVPRDRSAQPPTFWPANRSDNSSKLLPGWDINRSAEQPIARCSLCLPALDCDDRKRSTCAMPTSRPMVLSSGIPSFAKADLYPCTKRQAPGSNGTSSDAAPTPPSMTMYLCRCGESRFSQKTWTGHSVRR